MITDPIETALQRMMRVHARKPAAARNTQAANAELVNGLRCVVTEGVVRTEMDMPEFLGGGGSAPSPGVFARAAVAGCVAIGLRITAARLGVAVQTASVDVEMDFDNSAIFGIGMASAAPLETRLTIRLGSDAPEDRLAGLVEEALACDPYFLALRNVQTVTTKIERA